MLLPPLPASFVFSLFTVSVLSSKGVCLFAYLGSVGLGAFVVYLPTCLAADLVVLSLFRWLVNRERASYPITYLYFTTLVS